MPRVVKAGAVKASRRIEAGYLRGLLAAVVATWRHISRDPTAEIDDILVNVAYPALDWMLIESDRFHLKRFLDAVKKAGAVAQMRAASASVSTLIADRREDNVRLITSMTDQQRDLARLAIGEVSEIPLSTRLEQGLHISRVRARLIAADQVSKLNSQLSHIRATAAGSRRYQWSTSGDERVRHLHENLNGNIYDYGAPTGAEDGLEPGLPVRCRCVGIALFD